MICMGVLVAGACGAGDDETICTAACIPAGKSSRSADIPDVALQRNLDGNRYARLVLQI
jgi:hypothetical protein